MVQWILDDEDNVDSCESDIEFYSKLTQADETKEISNLMYKPDVLDLYGQRNRIYQISDIKFKNVSFKSTELCNLKFINCTFENCLFIATKFKKCEFYASQFIKTNFAYSEFYDTYIEPTVLKELFDTKEANLAVRMYQNLLDNFKSASQIELAMDAEYLFYKWRHKYTRNNINVLKEIIKRNHKNGALDTNKNKLNCKKLKQAKLKNRWYWLLWSVGYGIQIWYFFSTIFMLFLFFVLVNYLCWECYAVSLPSELTPVEFKTVVQYTFYTFASYGATPYAATSTFGILLAIIQGIIGWIIVGTGLAMIIKKIVR